MKTNIKAKVLQSSICSQTGQQVVSFELEYQRLVHQECLTHRVFSRNSASSRAIPVEKMHKLILENPAKPSMWGLNEPGMQSYKSIPEELVPQVEGIWTNACESAVGYSKQLYDLGLHKQVCNRLTEPFQYMKVVLTGTEFKNFFELRLHETADPTIRRLAEKMAFKLHYSQYDKNTLLIHPGEYHVPYIQRQRDNKGVLKYYSEGEEVSLEDALKISGSCCAQVSYRNLDTSLEKAKKIYKMLIESKPAHASPVEHQCTPIDNSFFKRVFWTRQKGVTHKDKQGNLWSNNFKGFIQHRSLLGV